MSNTCNLLHISRVQVGLIQCEWLIISINFRKKLLGQIIVIRNGMTFDYGQIGNRVSHDQWPTVILTTDQQKNSMLFSLLLHYTFLPPGLGLGLCPTVKLSAAFFHDESSVTMGGGGYESAIVPFFLINHSRCIAESFSGQVRFSKFRAGLLKYYIYMLNDILDLFKVPSFEYMCK